MQGVLAVGLLLATSSPMPEAEPHVAPLTPHARTTVACTACHPPSIAAHLRDWDGSVHARAGVTCTSCHTQARLAAGSEPKAPSVDDMCKPCHADLDEAFRTSGHYLEATRGGAAPRCTDCHTTAGGNILPPEKLALTCAHCHAQDASGRTNDRSARAVALLDLLRSVTLAQTLVAEQVAELGRSGRDVERWLEALRTINLDFRDLGIEWHRFDFDRAERRSHRTLQQLEALHTQVSEVPR